jgi:alanyl-tRNA synthetase
MKTFEIRDHYLRFFGERGHRVLPSASLVPVGDPSVLLTSAGMQQFKPYFSGERPSPYPRIATVQKCFRTTDLDEVGDLSHLTFFEMLGNFSFGDYFKVEAIAWARELVQDVVGIEPARIWATVYEGSPGVPRDEEAADIWADLGHPRERIAYAGEDNFWGPTGDSGPCGPTTELHVNLRPDLPDVGPLVAPEQYLEIWNLVFNQYFKSVDGELTPLAQHGVDTGAGLERWAVVLQDVGSIYETDTWWPLLQTASKGAGLEYQAERESGRSLRVIAQHSRAAAFLIGDGVMPGNEGRGYILRRSIRQGVRHARQLGIESEALAPVVATAIDVMSEEGYEDLQPRADFIRSVVSDEEQRFRRTLDAGVARLDDLLTSVPTGGEVDGARMFELYDTFGFPPDITKDIAAARGVGVDEAGFDAALAEQRARSRAAQSDGQARDLPTGFGESVFLGYDFVTEGEGTIVALARDGELLDSVTADGAVMLVMDQTPFYGEAGGQVGDTGTLEGPHGAARVTDTLKNPEGTVVMAAEVTRGRLAVGEHVQARVDRERRFSIMRNHTATHLLHAGLRRTLGDHVRQAGSLVAPDRLRFDFTNPSPVSDEHVRQIQHWVNSQILHDYPLVTEVTEVQAAVEAGAMALFGEKYGEQVRMVRMGEISRELCGGTHCVSSNQIGLFAIVQESGIAAGVRRIEAVTGAGAVALVEHSQDLLAGVAQQLESAPAEAPERVRRLLEQQADLRRRLQQAERAEARRLAENLAAGAIGLGPISMVLADTPVGNRGALRGLTDDLRQRLESPWVIVLAATIEGRPAFVAAASDESVAAGVNAGALARAMATTAGGGGGGRPELAMAGGRDPARIPDALEAGRAYVAELAGAS